MENKCLRESEYLKGDGEHICYLCEISFKCPSDNKKECKCETVFAYCTCKKCVNPLSQVKGIVAFTCPQPCLAFDDEDEDFDNDDSSLFQN